MQKNKIKKIFLTAAVLFGLSLTASGCAMVSVNPERDNAQVIAVIDGQEIKKEDFNNYMAYYDMYYQANGSSMPTGSDLEDLKQSVFESLIQTDAMAAQGRKDKKEVDEAETEKSAEDSLKSLKEEMGDKYDSILASYYTNDDSLTAFMKKYMVDSAYAGEAYTAHTDYLMEHPEEILDTEVGTINNEAVKRGEYNYYAILQELSQYSSQTGTSSTDEDTTNEEIFNSIAEKRAMIQYCEDNGIEIKEDDINANLESAKSLMETYFPEGEGLSDYLENYFLTEDKFEEYQKDAAKGAAAETAIQAKMKEDASVTDKEIQKYYDENKDSFDESTVSAEHILTEDKNLADEIYQKAKDCKTKDEFTKVMDAYKDNDQVKEASDLGAFNRTKMVTEFSDAAFAMDVNTVSEPVKTEYGYHIIFVYDKDEKAVPSLEDKKDSITDTLKSDKASEEFTEFKEKTEKSQKIKIDDIKSVAELYMDQLKNDLNITTYENRIK